MKGRNIFMESLDLNSTRIFCELLERMNGKPHGKLFSPGYTPLTIEKLGGKFSSIWGEGRFYSLCHYCKRQGDMMQDPEMCFLVVDTGRMRMTLPRCISCPIVFRMTCLGFTRKASLF